MSCDTKPKGPSGAERMRYSRHIRREGFVGVIGVEVHQREVAALVARGLLADSDRHDRVAIAVGLGRLLDAVLATE